MFFAGTCRFLNYSSKRTNLRKLSSKSWHVTDYRGIDSLHCFDDVNLPIIKNPTDVLIKVKAASVNPLDVAMTEGYGREVFNKMKQLDCSSSGSLVTGRDFSGVIEAKGAGVNNLSVGQEVFGVISPPFSGSHAHYTVASSSNVQVKPENVSFEEAASLPYAGLTAWSALRITGELGETSSNKKVLVLGASGGVGTIAVQLLKLWKTTVIATCGTDAVPLVQSLGVDEVIDYKAPDSEYSLQKCGQYDIILDLTGKNMLEKADLLKPWNNAKYITLNPPTLRNFDQYGILGGIFKNAVDLITSNVTALSNGRTIRWAFFTPNPTAMQTFKEYLENNKIRPVVDSVYSFDDLPQAFERMRNGHPRGKIVILMNED